MRHLRLAVGYTTEHRTDAPVVLASSLNHEEIQAAIDWAPPEFLRFEIGIFHFTRRGRRVAPVPASPAIAPEPELPHTPKDEEPSAPDMTAGAEQAETDEDGPILNAVDHEAEPAKSLRTR